MKCDRCLYADSIGGYPDGQDMFCCQMVNNPLMPFEMNKDTICPCFRVDPHLVKFQFRPPGGKWHTSEFTPDAVRKHYFQGDSISIRYQTVSFYCLAVAYRRGLHHVRADPTRTLDGRRWALTTDDRIIYWGC